MGSGNDEAPAGATAEASDDVSSLPSKIDRYSKARQRATKMMRHLDEVGKGETVFLPSFGATAVAKKLALCGNWLQFRHYTRVGTVKLVGAMFCRVHLLCPLCALRRAGKALRVYNERLEVLRAADPSMRVVLVTLTVRNGPSLEERFAHLVGAWRTLLHRRLDTKGSFNSVLRRVSGAVASFEVTNGGKGWHPHLHALAVMRSGPSDAEIDRFRSDLRAEWEEITGDSFECDARPVTDDVGAFLEVLKYALKFGDLSLENNWEAYSTLRGRRLITSFGCFRGVQVPEQLLDDEMLDEPFVDIVYRWMFGAEVYTVHRVCSTLVEPSA